jgi:ceramide glucosyltransferase
MAEVALALAALMLALLGLRATLALLALRGTDDAAPGDAGPPGGAAAVGTARAEDVTVLQTIRSGDPLLPGLLRENLRNQPQARFVWLVDEDDPAGRAIADAAAPEESRDRIEVLVVPPLPQGRSPKVFKLVLGLPRCGDVLAVLDDDTVLPPGALERAVAALRRGDLVTSVPVYREQGSLWSRLVAAFVNGGSLLTYLPMSRVADPVTINGMFFVTRRAVLESLGGFAAIEDRLCDDYEIARLYRAAGRRIVQSTAVIPLTTTVHGPRAYARIMRRWMVFARQVLGGDLSPGLALLILVPAALPLGALTAAVASGRPVALAAVGAALLVKVMTTALLRRRVPPAPASVGGALLEVVADLLLPFHVLAAAVRPARITWRDRRIDAAGGVLTVREAR